jgi:ubiquinone/menaquinone biosynthesis C-methylase UbiE
MRWSTLYIRKALAFLKRAEITISGTWIDCGCGYGIYSEALMLLGANPVVAIDSRFSLLTSIDSPILAVNSDCCDLPVRNCFVSGVLYVNVLHYYRNVHSFLEEAYRVLNCHGHILIIEYRQLAPTSWNPHPLSMNEAESVLEDCNFDIVTTAFIDTKYRPKYVIAGKKSR